MAPHTVASDVFSVIGDESRRRILEVLATREATVSELVALLDRPQPQVSKHLGVLREAGAVQCRPDGRARIYRLDPAALAPLARWLDRLTTRRSRSGTTCPPRTPSSPSPAEAPAGDHPVRPEDRRARPTATS